MRVTGLDHFVLRVTDLDRTLSFYRDLLGIPVEFLDDYRQGTRPFVSLRVGPSLIDLVPDPHFDAEKGRQHGGFLHFCIRIDEPTLEEAIRQLREAGIDLLEEAPSSRMGATGMGPSIYARDPDGYVVELKAEG